MRLLRLNYAQQIAALVWARRGLVVLGVPACVLVALSRPVWLLLLLPLGAALHAALKAWEQSLRRQFIRDADFPPFLLGKIIEAHPGLLPRDAELVLRGLRQFFMAHLRSGRRFVGMPSKVVDTAWHAYILHTKGYQLWCQRAFGGTLHHTPAEVMARNKPQRNDGLRRTWYWACKEESIDPRKPTRLPLLFALDGKFAIDGGFSYVPDCQAIGERSDGASYCGTDFGSNESGGSDSSSGDFGGSESSASDGSGDSSGSSDGGSSDGGGCGGGCGGGD